MEFDNVLQTNATLLNRDWADFFFENRFGIGVSLDGPQWLHDLNRRYVSGGGSYSDVLAGIALLKARGITPGVLAVVTKHSLGHEEEIYHHFDSVGLRSFDFLPCVEIDFERSVPGRPVLLAGSLEQGEYGRFMSRIFDLWMMQDNPDIQVRSLMQVLKGLLGGRPGLCKFSGRCHEFLTLEVNGDVSACGNLSYGNLQGQEELIFGNINTHTLADIMNSPARRTYEGRLRIPEKCRRCTYNSICNGGCSKYRYMWEGEFLSQNYLCRDSIQIFNHVSHFLNQEHPRAIQANPGHPGLLVPLSL